jgi:hypothetical protein
MSLRENELQRPRTRRQKQKKSHRTKNPQRASSLAAPLPMTTLHDDQVLSFYQWCALNHISERTGRRIIKRPDGPAVTKLSAKRIGVTVGANHRWQQSRARGRVS